MVNIITSIVNPLVSTVLKLYGLTSQTVEVNPGTLIHFWAPQTTPWTKNDNKKPAVVLIHGFAGNGALTWVPQVVALAVMYSLYVPDLVFFGGSITENDVDRGMEFQAECVAQGLRHLGVKRCVVVGTSYGGGVGSRIAESNPELVRCLVLSNSNVGMSEGHSQGVFDRVRVGSWPELMLPESVEGLKRLLAAVVVKRPWVPCWVYAHYLEVMFDNRKERAELIKAAVVKDKDFYIPNFSQKVYFITGEEDKIFDIETVRRTYKHLGEKATLYCIEKAGHLVHLERPFIYNRLLKKILGSLEA